jgi:hypothetical protein
MRAVLAACVSQSLYIDIFEDHKFEALLNVGDKVFIGL